MWSKLTPSILATVVLFASTASYGSGPTGTEIITERIAARKGLLL